MDELFEACARSSGLLLLLDGLDEVATPAFDVIARALRLLSDHLSRLSAQNYCVMTMRSQFHNQVAREFESAFPQILHVQRFSASDIYRFLTNWFRTQHEPLSSANRIYAELTDRPTLRDMCTNPLVLSMYVANYQTAAATSLPDTRTAFYTEVVKELLVMRRSRQLDSRRARIAQLEQRRVLFGELALANMRDAASPANTILWADAIRLTRSLTGCSSDDEAETIFRQIAVDTGLVAEERVGESFRFIHLTFCEYFAGGRAASLGEEGWMALADAQRSISPSARQGTARLAEVIPFCVGMIESRLRAWALFQVLEFGDPELFGRCLLETQAFDHPAWPEYVEAETAFFAASDPSDWDEVWLRRLQLFATVVTEAKDVAETIHANIDTPNLEQLFSSLVGNSKDRLTLIFATYAGDAPAPAYRLAESVGVNLIEEAPGLLVNACSDPPFLAFVLQKAASDSLHRAQWASVLAEAALRYPVVARDLNNRAAPDAWLPAAASLGRRFRWDEGPGSAARGSYLGVALTLSYDLKGSRDDDPAFFLLPHVHALKPPGAPAWVRSSLTVVGIFLLVALSGAAAVAMIGRDQPLALLVGFESLVIVVLLPFLYIVGRIRIYREVLNLRPVTSSLLGGVPFLMRVYLGLTVRMIDRSFYRQADFIVQERVHSPRFAGTLDDRDFAEAAT